MNQSDQKKDYPGIKTHEEILDLFKEVESIEGKLKSPELIEDIYTESETVKKEAGSTKTTGELPAEPQSSKIPTESELKDKIKAEKKKGKKHKISFPYKIRRSKKPKAPKAKRFLRFLKIKPGETEISEPTELQDQLEEPKGEIKPIKSTFTLRIDDNGHLVGFNIKKPKPKKEKKSRRILLFRRKKGEVGASADPAAEKL